MRRLAAFSLHHRRLVIAVWVVLLVAGGAGASRLSDRLSFDFSLPGQPGYETAKKLVQTYGSGGTQPPALAVVTVPPGRTVAHERDRIAAAFARVGQQFPQLRGVGYVETGDQRFVTGDGRTTYTMWFDPPPRGFVPPTSRQAGVPRRCRPGSPPA